MKLNSLSSAVIDAIHRLLFSTEFLCRSRVCPSFFTRNRKLSFVDFMLFLLSGEKNSLQGALNYFLDRTSRTMQTYSKQAFSKGRKRIRPEAFKEMSDTVVQTVYQKAETTRKWHQYHLLAIDGSKLNLPNNPELIEEFGVQITGGSPQPQALCSCMADVLNDLIVDARLSGCKGNERKHAEEMICALDPELIANPLYLMDRGYPSHNLIALIESLGQNYLFRCDKSFLHAVKRTGTDVIVTHRFGGAKEPVQFRLITVTLASGEEEYLITNLYDETLSVDDFSELYHYRWGIETKYNDLKGKLQIENFTGNTPIAIRQDFFATLYLVNMAGGFIIDNRDEIEAYHNTPDNKYTYKMNVNRTISELKHNVISLLISKTMIERSFRLTQIVRRLRSAVVPIRPGRSNPRSIKHAKSKYPQNRKLP